MDLSAGSLQTKNTARIDNEIQARLAWELLHLELDYWRETGALIHPHLLTLIHQRRAALSQLAKDEAELLFRSALAAGSGISEWVERAWLAGVPVDVISLEDLQHDNFRARAAAVAALGTLGFLHEQGGQFVGSIIKMLGDNYPQVRVAAIHALAQLQPAGEWHKHLAYECYVPAGEFVMGDNGTDLYGRKVPAHNVWTDAFYIGKYPVTNADYQRYVDDGGNVGYEFEPPEGKTDHPVVDISWHQARDYASWAGMRLLTEAEWEKAASWASLTNQEKNDPDTEKQPHKEQRDKGHWPHLWKRLGIGWTRDQEQEEKAIDSRKLVYPWGNSFDPNRCNTGETALDDTTPVGRYSPQGDSPSGCADMMGNVWEWTSSLYRDYAYQADDGREDTALPGYRVVRGGSFFSYRRTARSAGRFGLGPYSCNLYRGFRVGMSANPKLALK